MNMMDMFPKELADTIADGKKHGVSDDQMVKGMISVGNLLGRFVKADTPEEAMMKEMWEMADNREKEMLASLILRLGKKHLH